MRSRSSSSGTTTSCGTSSCKGSSRRTIATPRRPAPPVAGDRRRDVQPKWSGYRRARRGRAGARRARRGGRRRRGARDRVRRARRDSRAEERASRRRRGDGCPLVPPGRAGGIAGGRAACARGRRPVSGRRRVRVARSARSRPSTSARVRPWGRDGSSRAGVLNSMTRHRSPSLFQSFNHATEGIVHAVRTQRNLWVHFAVAAVVLVAAVGFGGSKLELAVLLLAITFVLVAELGNTPGEAAGDAAPTPFAPLAKIAKDIA